VLYTCSSTVYNTQNLIIFFCNQVETWEGPKLNLDFCINFLGIQQANYTSHLPSFITSFAREHKFGFQIWKDVSRPFRVLDDVISQIGGSIPTLDLLPVLHHLRVVKSKCEQELMRKSCSIISDAVVETMKVIEHNQFYCL